MNSSHPARTQPKDSIFWNDRARRRAQLFGHAPVCGPNEATPDDGVTWRDMPGNEEVSKRFDFSLHRRGLLPGSRNKKNGRFYTTTGAANLKRRQSAHGLETAAKS